MMGPILIPETLIVWFLNSKTISKVATQSKPLENWPAISVTQITGWEFKYLQFILTHARLKSASQTLN